jgi:ribosome biogenesis GTPase
MSNPITLSELGWSHLFQQQLSLEEYEACTPARVVGQERTLLHLLAENGDLALAMTPSMDPITVGDWLLLDGEGRFHRLLERASLFSRKAAGSRATRQLIAANVDTVFVVSSMNADFNLNRLERYLALAHEADVEAVILLTKIDRCDDPDGYLERARGLARNTPVVPLNSLDQESVRQLLPWCAAGRTLAFLGSSGVGKSSLINTLSGDAMQRTQGIREDDAKGRHTTTGRALVRLASGALLLDTPGMRELQLADCEHGVEEAFAEITELASRCRFSDCQHQQEPGCAVREAIESDELEQRRLASYQKLMREQAFNKATLAERRAQEREFGRHVRSVIKGKQGEKGR